ncbi:hypothetical protein LIER_38880 [Lithospermum erythrorhizon]|uniref:Mitochondrial protein n=1 Tax=Lithospermum erythrorhizon TaxID=34254 RepID=A0AAV3Q8J1_LITER
MDTPRSDHMLALKRVLRYIYGTLEYGLHLYKSSFCPLISYTDVVWAGCSDTRKSTSGFCVLLGDNLISRSSKHQATISRSSAKPKYRGVTNVVCEAYWLHNLLLELHHTLQKAIIVYLHQRSSTDFITDFRDSLRVLPLPATTTGVY